MDYVHVRATLSFNGFRLGEEAVREDTPSLRAWVSAGCLEVIDSGTDQTGPSGAEPDAEGELPGDGGDSGEAGGGEGEGARPRRHRKTSSVDPS